MFKNSSILYSKRKSLNDYNPVIDSNTVILSENNSNNIITDGDIYLKTANLLSEFNTENRKRIARFNLDVLDSKTSVDPANHPYTTEEDEDIKNVKLALDKLIYKELLITNYSINPSQVENGNTINKVTLNWEYSKKIKSQNINSTELDINNREFIYTLSLNSTKQFTLTALDSKNTISKTIQVLFIDGKYYGVFNTNPSSEEIINNFTLNLNLNKGSKFTVTASLNLYIYVMVPKYMNNLQFSVNGFDGGFLIVDNNYLFNKFGKTFQCILYRSDYPNLGNTTVNIK